MVVKKANESPYGIEELYKKRDIKRLYRNKKECSATLENPKLSEQKEGIIVPGPSGSKKGLGESSQKEDGGEGLEGTSLKVTTNNSFKGIERNARYY